MKIGRFSFLVCLLVVINVLPQEAVDFTEGRIRIRIDPESETISGNVLYEFISAEKIDSVSIDARDMEILAVTMNNKKTGYTYDGQQLTAFRKLRPGKTYELQIEYRASPKKAVYFIGWHDQIPENNQVWTQGQGKYSSHWVPSFDNMSEKVRFNLELGMDSNYEVIANGSLTHTQEEGGSKWWKYTMKRPMSSYLLAFAAGPYQSETLYSNSGIPLVNYYYRGENDRLEPTYRHTKQIMDYLEEEIGIPYPWQNYKQVPVRDFLYAGMENTGTTIFSDGYFIDSLAFEDKNYVEVNAHEMAHQWFGNLVTEVASRDHWLHEGFATYYSLLSRKMIYGEDHFYWDLFGSAETLKGTDGQALTDPGASSLTFYEKGAWALIVLRDTIGDQAFRNGIREYLNEYAYSNATVPGFLQVLQKQTSIDLSHFREQWLEDPDFPYDKAREYLERNSSSVKAWYDLRWELTTSREENESIIKRYWENSESAFFKKKVLSQYTRSLSPTFLKQILDSGDPELRKTIAVHTERIAKEIQPEFESLLSDESYVTRENALFKLWIYFPAKRIEYLDLTRDVIGLPNYNMRIMWLFLAILTQDFETEEDRLKYREELFGYTSPIYSFEVRQTAFSVITEVFELPEQNLKDLLNASVHPVWQFRSYARNLLARILKDEKQAERLRQLSEELNEEEKRYLIRQLESK